MFGAIFCLTSAIGSFYAARRSRGAGIAFLLGVGYLYGILRAIFLDGASHFAFDVGLLAIYAAEFFRHASTEERFKSRAVTNWLIALVGWPLVCIAYSPVVESQHILIQLVGLRASVFMLPIAVVGARFVRDDVALVGKALSWFNLVALAMAMLEMQYGVARFFPQNDVSRIIYASRDVGEDLYFRIPSTFSSAHAYGGTMLLSVPFIVEALSTAKTRGQSLVAILGLLAAIVGIFASAARQPVVQLALTGALILATTRPSVRKTSAFFFLGIAVWLVVASSERFQRFLTLSDTEFVQQRFAESVNKSFLDVVTQYPMGAGLGSAVGTSIPFFLTTYAKPAIGLENEYARIALEQGVVGLLVWCVFLVWALRPQASRSGAFSAIGRKSAWVTLLGTWGAAVIGVGVLTAIPGTTMAMLFIGMLNAVAARNTAQTQPNTEEPRSHSSLREIATTSLRRA